MHRMIVGTYEEKLKAVVAENNDLRSSLITLQQELHDILTNKQVISYLLQY